MHFHSNLLETLMKVEVAKAKNVRSSVSAEKRCKKETKNLANEGVWILTRN